MRKDGSKLRNSDFNIENVDPTLADVVEETIINSISEQTGVPVNDVEVAFNTDTGVFEYSITTDSYNDSNDAKQNIDTDLFTDTIEAKLENIDSNIDVTASKVNDGVVADINIIIDTKDAAVDRNKATNNLSSDLQGFTVDNAEGIFNFKNKFHY